MAVYTAADADCTWTLSGGSAVVIGNFKRATVSHSNPEKVYATAGSGGIKRNVGHKDVTATIEVYVDDGATPLDFTVGTLGLLDITMNGTDVAVNRYMRVLSIEYSPDVEAADNLLAVIQLARAATPPE